MTAPVDVLAVMDADISLRRSIYDEGRGTKPIARTEQNAHNLACAIEARAAIAELIEAASTRIEWRNGLWFVLDREGLPLSGGHESEAAARFEQTEALHEALARVGGAP